MVNRQAFRQKMQIIKLYRQFITTAISTDKSLYPCIPVSWFSPLLVVFLVFAGSVQAADLPVHGYEIVNTFPHDPDAFTQGLAFHDGKLYEGTGRNGQSTLRLVDLDSGEVQKLHRLNNRYFGEGITILGNKVYQLTWRSHIGFVYDLDTFTQEKSFFLAGEGWGITHDGESLIVSDGTAYLRILDPETLQEQRRIHVLLNGMPVQFLNELEYINGEVWANVWYQDYIVRIDPATGNVTSIVDLSDLYPDRKSREDVLNGIAWDAENERLIVTGKLWPAQYEINVLE